MEKFDDSHLADALTLLGQSGAQAQNNLECFPAPANCGVVTLKSKEITANCPKTGQPDFYAVEVRYFPKLKCLESKAFKLYLQTFRNTGHFIEAFATIILQDLASQLDPVWMSVNLEMVPRGGIGIQVTTEIGTLPAHMARSFLPSPL